MRLTTCRGVEDGASRLLSFFWMLMRIFLVAFLDVCSLDATSRSARWFVADVAELCCSCPHLKELDLSDAHALSDAAVASVVSTLRGLEYMALSRCYQVPPAAYP